MSISEYDKLIDLGEEELKKIISESETLSEKLKSEIIKNYQLAEPYLTQMRLLKTQLKKVNDKKEAAKTFLSMEKNGSLISSIDLEEVKKINSVNNSVNNNTNTSTTPQTNLNINKGSVVNKNVKFKSPLVANWINKSKKR